MGCPLRFANPHLKHQLSRPVRLELVTPILVFLGKFSLVLAGGGFANWSNGRAGKPFDRSVPKWHRLAMAQVIGKPRKRITARVSDSVRNTLEQAAELLGANVNQFIVQTAYVEAQRVIERESVIRLSQKDAHKVLSLLDNPPKANKRLQYAVKHFKGTVRA